MLVKIKIHNCSEKISFDFYFVGDNHLNSKIIWTGNLFLMTMLLARTNCNKSKIADQTLFLGILNIIRKHLFDGVRFHFT